jgi:hypothetical protein
MCGFAGVSGRWGNRQRGWLGPDSTRVTNASGGLAAWAAAKQLEQVALDAIAGAIFEALDHRAQFTVVEGGQCTAFGADHVMPVALAQAVAVAVIEAVDALERVELGQQFHRTKDAGNARRSALVCEPLLDVVDGKAVAKCAHGLEHGKTRLGELVAAVAQLIREPFDGGRKNGVAWL